MEIESEKPAGYWDSVLADKLAKIATNRTSFVKGFITSFSFSLNIDMGKFLKRSWNINLFKNFVLLYELFTVS